jgi:hypothetical protein
MSWYGDSAAREALHGGELARCAACGQMRNGDSMTEVDDDVLVCENCVENYADGNPVGEYPRVPLNASPRSWAGDLEQRTIDTGIELVGGWELRAHPSWDGHLDELLGGMVTAYALRWNVPVLAKTVAGEACWVQYRNDSCDEWLSRQDAEEWPRVLLSHGWGPIAGDYRGGFPDEIGQSVSVQRDEVGLLTTSALLESRSGTGPLDGIRRGDLRAFSAHCEVVESREIGRFKGLPLFEVTRAWPVEFGPTHDPSDPGAVIVALGDLPIEQARARYAAEVAEMRARLGIEDESRWADDARALRSAQAADARDAVRAVQSLAGVVAYHRGQAWAAFGDYRRTGRGEFYTAALEARRRAEDADAELRDAVCNDGFLHRDVLASVGAPEPLSVLRLAGVDPVVHASSEAYVDSTLRRRDEVRAAWFGELR